LKAIEAEVGIERPDDLQGVDGSDAELYWKLWTIRKDRAAREKLIRYCAADVVGLQLLAAKLLRARGIETTVPDSIWNLLLSAAVELPQDKARLTSRTPNSDAEKLRARWDRMKAIRLARTSATP
jgi:hypothetical protein